MPSPAVARTRLPYVPALDGLRGIAVAVVLLFHADLSFAQGGHLGVTVFFTLSGFLITSLLLVERQSTGRIDLKRFWGGRARRLVPAMLLCFPLVALLVHTSPRPAGDGLLWDATAALGWVANWRFVLDQQTYADLFALPSPFQHFWSLAVEEQFYVVFPLLVVVALGSVAARPRTRRLALVVGLLTVVSTVQLFHLRATGDGFSRAYYGTDGRVAELLVGALLALALVTPAGWRQLGPRARTGADALGLLGLAGLVVAFVVARTDSALLYRGGFLAVALCTAAVLAAVVQPGSLLARPLSAPPLVLLGVISYGVYLFHWPVFLLVTEDVVPRSAGEVLLLQLGVTLALAFLSYVLVERPVRYGVVPVVQGLTTWAAGAAAGIAVIAFATGALTLPTPGPLAPSTAVAGGLAPAGVPQPGTTAQQRVRQRQEASRQPRGTAPLTGQQRQAAQPVVPPPPSQPSRKQASVPSQFYKDPADSKVPPVPVVPDGAVKVVMVGDSLGDNLGSGLRAWAKDRTDVVVYNLAVPACPHSRGKDRRIGPSTRFDVDPSCAWWDDPGSKRYQAFQEFDPDVVVTEDGINEVFDRRLPQWGGWRSPGQPQFDSWLYDEYGTVFDRWRAGGAQLLLVNTPCGDWDRTFQEVQNPELRVQSVNLVYERLAGVSRADLFQRVCPNGQYSDEVEGIPDARPDGFHFIPEASAALATNWLGPLVLQTAKSGRSPLQTGSR